MDHKRMIIGDLEAVEHLKEGPLIAFLEPVQRVEIREDRMRIADLAVREFDTITNLECIRQTIWIISQLVASEGAYVPSGLIVMSVS